MSHPIPLKVLDQHLAILGKTGAGKSYALRGLIELLLDAKNRVCIVDPKGDHWGILSSADGKKAGYPVVAFGKFKVALKDAIPINPRVGADVAELVATGNRPCVIGFRGWMPGDRTRFWIDFASTLFNKNEAPLWLIVDEVHNFAAQGKVMDPEAGKCLHWTNRIATEGRGLGIRLLMASQRPQKVHKDTLTCAETLMAMRVIHPLDRNAMKEWIDGCGDAERGKMVLNALASMKRGEAFVWSPEIEFFKRLTFPIISTFDSYKAPTGDAKDKTPSGWAEVNLDEVRKRLARTIEEAKANDPELLKKRIRDLEKGVVPVVDQKAITRAIEEVKRTAAREHNEATKAMEKHIIGYVDTIKRTRESLTATLHLLERAAISPKLPELRDLNARVNSRPDPVSRMIAQSMGVAPSAVQDDLAGAIFNTRGDERLPEGERKVLLAVASYEDGLTRDEISVLAKYRRSSRDAYISRLAAKGLVETGDRIVATAAGKEALGPDHEILPTGEKLIEHWRSHLPQGEAAIFNALVSNFPDALTRDRLSEMVDYKRSSRDAYLARLKGRRLIEESRGAIRASKTLFQ